MRPPHIGFIGGASGGWRVDRMTTVSGDPLPATPRLRIVEACAVDDAPQDAAWILRGVASHERYASRAERDALVDRQPLLGRPQSTAAALIPIRKSAAWWDLAQDERRRIFEESSHHLAIGLEYLPAVARRLLHARDLGEPFDFLTWFEFNPIAAASFEDLVRRLRATEEWSYVEREVDIRLTREESI